MFSRKPWMVGWYSPRLLLKAGVEVLVSTLFGQHADQRTVQALAGPAHIMDYSGGSRIYRNVESIDWIVFETASRPVEGTGDEEFWFDYVADVGDGWDSTYSVAYQLSRPQLTVTDAAGNEHRLEEGRLLVFGGDQVYPTASREEYDRRFLGPYARAFADGQERGEIDVYAIPGNHDWYDSLKSFGRIFFTKEPFVEGKHIQTRLETPQTRSYFAIKLPHGWWLLGTDVQLGSDIDGNQLEFFRSVLRHIGPNDQIILCTAEPHWLQPKREEKREFKQGSTALDQLEREVLRGRVSVFVAGDVHHYMRYQSGAGGGAKHKITAGGGGAFLHPTHRTWRRRLEGGFQRVASSIFPPMGRSAWISLRNILFPLLNPRFGILTATLYMVFTLMLLPALLRVRDKQLANEASAFDERLAELDAVTSRRQREIQLLANDFADDAWWGKRHRGEIVAGRLDFATRAQLGDRRDSPVNIPMLALQQIESRYEVDNVTPDDLSASAPPMDPLPGRTKIKPPDDAEAEISSKIQDIQRFAKKYERTIVEKDRLQQQIQEPDFVAKMSGLLVEAAEPLEPEAREAEESAPSGREKSMVDVLPPMSDSERIGPPRDRKKWESDRVRESPLAVMFVAPLRVLWDVSAQEIELPRPFESMLAVVIFVGAIGGFVAFTDIPKPWGRIILGTLHGIVHWMAAFYLTAWASTFLGNFPTATASILGVIAIIFMALVVLSGDSGHESRVRQFLTLIAVASVLSCFFYVVATQSNLRLLGIVAFVFVSGWVVGSGIMGLYLLLTHSLFGQHWNESFSSVRCKDWKCFLRFRIDKSGTLTIYPIGIPKVCRSWRSSDVHVEPKTKKGIPCRLIENPIKIQQG